MSFDVMCVGVCVAGGAGTDTSKESTGFCTSAPLRTPLWVLSLDVSATVEREESTEAE